MEEGPHECQTPKVSEGYRAAWATKTQSKVCSTVYYCVGSGRSGPFSERPPQLGRRVEGGQRRVLETSLDFRQVKWKKYAQVLSTVPTTWLGSKQTAVEQK